MKHRVNIFITLLIAFTACANAYEIAKIKFVDSNNAPIPYDMFINRVRLKAGMEFSPKLLSDDIKRLYETKNIIDCEAEIFVEEGEYVLKYKMTLNAIVGEIVFEGNDEFSDSKLGEKVEHPVGQVLNLEQLSKDKAKIYEMYSKAGKFNTQVEISTEDGSKPGEIKIVIKIKEIASYQLDEVEIVGVSVFDVDELQDEMKSQPSFWRYLFDTGFLNEDLLRYDMEQLQNQYENKGYLDFKHIKTERTYDEEYVSLKIFIQEGTPYVVRNISMKWLKSPGKKDQEDIFNEKDLRPLLDVASGLLYNRDTEERDINRLTAKYINLGYLEFSCRTVLKPHPTSRQVDVEYHIYEGVPSVIRDIKIIGNTITRDHVIRRELAIHPTDLSNKLLIDKSKNRLLGLGYFKTVDISPVETGIEGEKDLLLKVEENETGRMSFGAGLSSASSFVGTIGLQQSNFDAGAGWPYRGGGQKMKASIEAGGRRNRIEITFIEPWLNNKPMSLATTISHATRYYDEYEEQHTGISLSLTSRIQSGMLNNWRFTRGFRLESVEVEVEDDVSAELRSEETSDLVSALFFNISKDTRNRVRRPTNGGRLSLMTDFQTEALGSENNIYKLRLTASEYISVFEESVIKFRGEIGVVDALGGDVPIYERFFAGGLNSLRGYKHRKVGPVDVNEDELGGSSTLLGTIELDVPLFKKVNGALFMDAGNVWESAYGWDPSDLNVTLGFGVRVDLPIGTLQLDYGKPVINNNVNGGSGRIHFNFGYQF